MQIEKQLNPHHNNGFPGFSGVLHSVLPHEGLKRLFPPCRTHLIPSQIGWLFVEAFQELLHLFEEQDKLLLSKKNTGLDIHSFKMDLCSDRYFLLYSLIPIYGMKWTRWRK